MDSHEIYGQIAILGRRLGAERVVLYGSRARGDHRPNSDIDIAVYGMPQANRSRFGWAVDDLPTLLEIDVAHISEETDPGFRANIEKDGVILMDKFQEKYAKLAQAVERLTEGLQDYEAYPIDSVRDGVIQRFKFCTELAWKTVREYLLDQGYQGGNSPKAVMRQAYADGLLSDESGWLALLDARNMTSHIYDETTAAGVFQDIRDKYLPLFRRLISALEKADVEE